MAKIKVLYGQPINAWLGGKLFNKGVAIFDNEEEGKKFAKRYFFKYEVIKEAESKPKRKTSSTSKKKANVSSRSVRKSG